jgi:HAD superfamily hydrolase (TIGR01458 family)
MAKNNLIIDITGTIVDDEWNPINKAIEALNGINDNPDVDYCLLSNVTTISRKNIHGSLTKIGFNINLEKIITPAIIAQDYILRNKLNMMLFVSDELINDEFSNIEVSNTPVDGVLLGDIQYSYTNMDKILNIVLNGANIYTLANNRIYKKDGRYKIDIGSWAKCLEYATRKTIKKNFGKPSQQIFEYAAESLNSKLYRCVVIGDDVETDVNGALKYGAKGILVRTGKYRKNDMDLMKDGHKLCFADIHKAMVYLKSLPLDNFFASKYI